MCVRVYRCPYVSKKGIESIKLGEEFGFPARNRPEAMAAPPRLQCASWLLMRTFKNAWLCSFSRWAFYSVTPTQDNIIFNILLLVLMTKERSWLEIKIFLGKRSTQLMPAWRSPTFTAGRTPRLVIRPGLFFLMEENVTAITTFSNPEPPQVANPPKHTHTHTLP